LAGVAAFLLLLAVLLPLLRGFFWKKERMSMAARRKSKTRIFRLSRQNAVIQTLRVRLQEDLAGLIKGYVVWRTATWDNFF
jgi:hypothetical protein